MTDGHHHTGKDPKSVASKAQQHGVVIFTVTYSAESDEELMESVADSGSGTHFHAESASDLREVFPLIADKLAVLSAP